MAKVELDSDERLLFECPGCGTCHGIRIGAGDGPRWSWNGDMDKPTFQPSILVRFTKLTDKGKQQYEEWKENGYPKTDSDFDNTPVVCHSFVTDGQIQFLSDCSHELAGQTVDLPEFDQ